MELLNNFFCFVSCSHRSNVCRWIYFFPFLCLGFSLTNLFFFVPKKIAVRLIIGFFLSSEKKKFCVLELCFVLGWILQYSPGDCIYCQRVIEVCCVSVCVGWCWRECRIGPIIVPMVFQKRWWSVPLLSDSHPAQRNDNSAQILVTSFLLVTTVKLISKAKQLYSKRKQEIVLCEHFGVLTLFLVSLPLINLCLELETCRCISPHSTPPSALPIPCEKNKPFFCIQINSL